MICLLIYLTSIFNFFFTTLTFEKPKHFVSMEDSQPLHYLPYAVSAALYCKFMANDKNKNT